MANCDSCGGVLGKDCFNPIECAEISHNMNRGYLELGIPQEKEEWIACIRNCKEVLSWALTHGNPSDGDTGTWFNAIANQVNECENYLNTSRPVIENGTLDDLPY